MPRTKPLTNRRDYWTGGYQQMSNGDTFDLTQTDPTPHQIIPDYTYADDEITPAHVAAAKEWLTQNAENFPDNRFLQSVYEWNSTKHYISNKQARGVLNFAAHDVPPNNTNRVRCGTMDDPRNAHAYYQPVAPMIQVKYEPPPKATPFTLPAPGTYTICRPNDENVTIEIRPAHTDPFWADKTTPDTMIASYLSGPDNESDYTGCAFIKSQPNPGVFLWKKFAQNARLSAALQALVADPDAAGYAYALKSGNCYRCRRKLTVPASIHRGLGPICATKV